MTEHVVSLDQLRTVRDGSGHSIFGASGNAHFLLCHGALIPNLLVKDSGNPDSAYGSVAHAITELWLRQGWRPEHLVGTTKVWDGFVVPIDEEMLEHVEQCVDICEFEIGKHLVEKRVDYSDITPIPNQGGTLDHAALRPGEAVITDHKFGKAEQHHAERHFQLMLYAYGIWREYNAEYQFKRFILRVNQPRLDHFDEWVISTQDLLAFAAWAKVQMAKAWAIDAPRTPGDVQCRYCKIATSCTASAMYQVALVRVDDVGEDRQSFASADMEAFKADILSDEFELYALDAGNLSTAHIAVLQRHSKTALRFWKSLPAELFRRAQMGEDLDPHGYKLVNGRNKRSFPNEEKASKALQAAGIPIEETFERTFVSPAQAEALLKSIGLKKKKIIEILDELIISTPGRVTLALASDKREAVSDIAAAAFGDESDITPDSEEL